MKTKWNYIFYWVRFSGNKIQYQNVRSTPEHTANGNIHTNVLPLGNIATERVIQNYFRGFKQSFVMVWCTFWRSRKNVESTQTILWLLLWRRLLHIPIPYLIFLLLFQSKEEGEVWDLGPRALNYASDSDAAMICQRRPKQGRVSPSHGRKILLKMCVWKRQLLAH